MADGATHDRYRKSAWVVILPLGFLAFVLSGWNYLYPIFLYLNYGLTDFVEPDLDHATMTKSEYDAQRKAKKLRIGFIGALFVSYSYLYSYMCGVIAGKSHRSWFSHGWVIGTIGRMVWFNIPVVLSLSYMVNYSISRWGTPAWTWDTLGLRYYYMHVWMRPYLFTQFIAWLIADATHLITDGIPPNSIHDKIKKEEKRNAKTKKRKR